MTAAPGGNEDAGSLLARAHAARAAGATSSAARNSGASTWCADMPDAFIAMTSLFWFSVTSVRMVPSSTEKGRKVSTICGMRIPT